MRKLGPFARGGVALLLASFSGCSVLTEWSAFGGDPCTDCDAGLTDTRESEDLNRGATDATIDATADAPLDALETTAR